MSDAEAPVRVIAFYLPQYHAIAENDAWWGRGFTEWTNVCKGEASFVGHWQPHEPGELGYYDLTEPAAREAQAQLASEHGVHAFCYYWYWFAGQRLLERPLDEVLAGGKPDFPFCICWANENWTRRWDGRADDVLMAQRYSPADSDALVAALAPYFRDARYVRVNGKPLFLVYRPGEIPEVAAHVAQWRQRFAELGVGEVYLAGVQRNAADDPTPLGFDASVEFPPIGHAAENRAAFVTPVRPSFRGSVFAYASLAADYLARPRPPFRTFRGVTPMWDNTARRQDDAMAVVESSPEAFGFWVECAARQTRERHRGDERLLFVNAWNEWAEGNHLEPDARHGRQYLEALAQALEDSRKPPPMRPSWNELRSEAAAALARSRIERFGRAGAVPRISVVMPTYNHATFLARTLASFAAQDVPLELVAVDDGSADGSADLIAAFARDAAFPVTLVCQANAGAHAALNRGLALASAPVIALANSDDVYAPGRLVALLEALGRTQCGLAFTDTEFIDDGDAAIDTRDGYVGILRAAIDGIAARGVLASLLQVNVAISTGNLAFHRALAERIGGFAALTVCHDWDFVLAASYVAVPAFVPRRLYRYRMHGGNTYTTGRLAGYVEGDVLLARFFAHIAEHPALVDTAQRKAFTDTARAAGLAGFLPPGW